MPVRIRNTLIPKRNVETNMGSIAVKEGQTAYQLRPVGWENDPEEERFKLSLFDPIILVVYCHFALYFRLDGTAETKERTSAVLKQGLEKTLSQVRHLAGKIEKDPEGGFSFVKKKDTAVEFVVKSLDSPEYPSIDDIEKASFSCKSLGNLSQYAIKDLPYGEGRPESDPENSPVISGFQLNFIRGGAVLSSHVHHWAADLVGWSNFVRQLADNCRAIYVANGDKDPSANIDFPPWDPACIDVSRYVKQLPAESLVDGPPVASRHPGHPKAQHSLLFHIPKSKTEELKRRAQPADGSSWVSTYDAMCAFVWRHLIRARIPFYKPDPDQPAPWFGEAVDMRLRFTDPAPPGRMIRNMLAGGFSEVAGIPLPTIGELAAADSEVPLSRLACYVRQLTNSVTQKHIEGLLEYIATLKDQRSISFNLMSKPPMAFFITDHRSADVSGCDFGFGSPITHRFLTGDDISANMILVYPPARDSDGSTGSDEGPMWAITLEEAVVPNLLADKEWAEFFEYRGID